MGEARETHQTLHKNLVNSEFCEKVVIIEYFWVVMVVTVTFFTTLVEHQP